MMKLRKCSICRAICLIAVLVLIAAGILEAQTIEQRSQIIPLGIGSYRKEHSSPFAAALMPASGPFMPKKSIGLYAENRFMLSGVAELQGAITIPIHSSLFSVSGHYSGTRFFSTQSIATGIGIRLSHRLSAGIKIGSYWMRISAAPGINTITADGGLMYAINERVLWGIHVRRGIATTKSFEKSGIYHEWIAGMGYTINKQLYLAYEISTASGNQLRSTVGLEWKASEKIQFSGGINTPMSNFFFNAGRKGKREMISVGFSSHAVLGYSGALLMEYELE